jgi:hypothetical protein
LKKQKLLKPYKNLWNIKLFLKLMHCFFSPQSYGTRIQNRFICDFGLKSVPAKKDKGEINADETKIYDSLVDSTKPNGLLNDDVELFCGVVSPCSCCDVPGYAYPEKCCEVPGYKDPKGVCKKNT